MGVFEDQSGMITIPLQENIYVDEAIIQILNAARWSWDYELDAGVDLKPYYWVDARSPARALHELAHSELGTIVIRTNGAIRYKSRLNQDASVITINDDDCMHVRQMMPRDAIRNIIKISTSPRSERPVQSVWELPGYIEIDAGETVDNVWAEYLYNGQTVPVKNPIVPVPSVDYLASQNSDGSGTDLTANISVNLYSFATRGNLAFTNHGATRAYVYWARVRGTPIASSNTVTLEYQDDDSIRQFGARPFQLAIDQNINIARQYRELLGLYLTRARNYLVVQLLPNSEKAFIPDLGDIVQGNFPKLGISQEFRIIHIAHKNSGNLTFTTWILEPYIRLFAGVQIPVQVPFQLGGSI
jgi:hypothetical protein